MLVFFNQRDPTYPDLFTIEIATGETSVLAEHSPADIGGLLTDPDTHEPIADALTVGRLPYHAGVWGRRPSGRAGLGRSPKAFERLTTPEPRD